MHNDANFFDKNTSGDIMYRFSMDADMACSGLLSNLKLFTTRVFSSLSLIGVLLYNSWELAIVAIIVLFGALFPLTRVRRKILSLMDKTIFAGGAVMTHYNETFNGNRLITSYNLYDYQSAVLRNAASDFQTRHENDSADRHVIAVDAFCRLARYRRGYLARQLFNRSRRNHQRELCFVYRGADYALYAD